MARATLTLPPILQGDGLAMAVQRAVAAGVREAGEEMTTDTKGRAPRFEGHLQEAIRWEQQDAPTRITGRIVVTPSVAPYADVMNRGRRPLANGPAPRHVRRWVDVKLREIVDRKAAEIRAKERPATDGKPKKDARTRALDSLSFAVARKIHEKGIKGRGFVTDKVVAVRKLRGAIGRQFSRLVAAVRQTGGAP